MSDRALLVVTRRPREEVPLRKALENEAWSLKTCAGPGNGDCPVMRGERCTLRESVDAAVVFVEPLHGGSGSIPRLRCAADSASPGVVAVEQSFESINYGIGIAAVGALRGPTAVIEAVTTLLGREDFRPGEGPSEQAGVTHRDLRAGSPSRVGNHPPG